MGATVVAGGILLFALERIRAPLWPSVLTGQQGLAAPGPPSSRRAASGGRAAG
ncbi:hypothetical protein ACGFYU_06935 [Streptomyces sp. NPDC048337]|uniref:hypothetical protein n=1 Tax=Streptomyces sp. NPDC048337 TaxID=3365535 RepID=UPI00371330DD